MAFRITLDYLEATEMPVLQDITPTDEMYTHTDRDMATGYYHCFFLILRSPLPEGLIRADPNFYLKSKLAAWGRSDTEVYSQEAVSEYLQGFRDPVSIHVSCEDNCAAATIDLEHDAADVHKKLNMSSLA